MQGANWPNAAAAVDHWAPIFYGAGKGALNEKRTKWTSTLRFGA